MPIAPRPARLASLTRRPTLTPTLLSGPPSLTDKTGQTRDAGYNPNSIASDQLEAYYEGYTASASTTNPYSQTTDTPYEAALTGFAAGVLLSRGGTRPPNPYSGQPNYSIWSDYLSLAYASHSVVSFAGLSSDDAYNAGYSDGYNSSAYNDSAYTGVQNDLYASGYTDGGDDSINSLPAGAPYQSAYRPDSAHAAWLRGYCDNVSNMAYVP